MEVFHDTATECHLPYVITVLPATRHKWTHPVLTPAIQAGTRFTYPGGMEGWVDLVDLIAPRPGVEPATFRSTSPNDCTTKTNVQYFVPVLVDQPFATCNAAAMSVDSTDGAHERGEMLLNENTPTMMANKHLPTSNNEFQRSYTLCTRGNKLKNISRSHTV